VDDVEGTDESQDMVGVDVGVVEWSGEGEKENSRWRLSMDKRRREWENDCVEVGEDGRRLSWSWSRLWSGAREGDVSAWLRWVYGEDWVEEEGKAGSEGNEVSNEARVLRFGVWKIWERMKEPRRERVGLRIRGGGGGSGDSPSVCRCVCRDVDDTCVPTLEAKMFFALGFVLLPTFLIERKAFEARDLNVLERFVGGAALSVGFCLSFRFTLTTSTISESSPGSLPRTVPRGP
jgi:hypothetical protein